jgi:phage head maturation protease
MTTENHEIEFAAGSPAERADARHDPAAAALRNAPAWVREKLDRIREERGEPALVERRGGVEHASEDRATAAVERSLSRAPAHIRRRVNEHRRRSGLAEIAVPRQEPTGPGVWVMRDGRLVPASAARTIGSSSSPVRPTPKRNANAVAAIVDRVLILPCPSFTDAAARNIGSTLPETIAPRAFGAAADLNRERSFDLRMGHHGPRLAIAGAALRCHDTTHGLVFEWIVDGRMPMAPDALRAIKRGCGVSIAFKAIESRTVRLPLPTNVVTRATLYHVALLDEDRPAYAAGAALTFPRSRAGDAEQLRKQIDALVAEARFRWRRSKQ